MRARITRSLQRFNRRQWRAISLAVLVTVAVCLVILWRSALAAETTIIVPQGSKSGNWSGNITDVDEGVTTTSDYISSGIANGDDSSATLDMQTIASLAQATSLTLHVCAYSATNVNGGTLDTLHNNIIINGTAQTAFSVTPPYSQSGDCTWYTHTYTGTWTQTDIDNLEAGFTRTVEGSGNPSNQIDELRIANTYITVVYSSPTEVSQASYRWFANDGGEALGSLGESTAYFLDDPASYMTSADFNGDQVADIASTYEPAETGLGLASVVLSDGVGGFAPQVDYSVGDAWIDQGLLGGYVSITSADFNGDQVADIAVSEARSYSVSVLINNGDGTFAAKDNYLFSSSLRAVVGADFNGDQLADIAVTNRDASSLFVRLNNGDGTFAAEAQYPLSDIADEIISADVNGDQIADLVVNYAETSNIATLANNGDGTFAAAVDLPVDDIVNTINSADFNGDQAADIAVKSNSIDTVSVYMNNGDGTFAPKVDYPTLDSDKVTSADMNGDQMTDLVIGSTLSSGGLASILLNNGDGTFAPKVDYSSPDTALGIIGADFNGDQAVDIAAPDIYGRLYVTFGQISPPQTTLAAIDTPAIAPASGVAFRLRLNLGVSVGDLGVAASYKVRYQQKSGATCSTDPLVYSDVTASSPIQFYDNETMADGLQYAPSDLDPVRSGVTSLGQNYKESNPFNPVAAIPAGQDGLWDFALTMGDTATAGTYCLMATKTDNTALNSYAVIPEITVESSIEQASYRWFANKSSHGTGAFPLQLIGSPNVAGGPWSLASADFNGDGIIDIATGNVDVMTVNILLGDGNANYTVNAEYLVGGQAWSLATADFNGDGIIDIATANSNGNSTSILIGNGDGTFAPRYDYPVGTAPHGVITVDFNGDQIIDIATVNSGVDTISVLLGDGSGLFSSAVAYPVGDAPDSLTSADFNGDQIPDIVATSYPSSTVSVLLGAGDGTFAAKVDYATGSGPYSVVTADFNGDGITDIATANYADDSISVLLGVGNGTFGVKVDYVTGSFPQSLTSADFNGDGITDIATANNSGQTTSILLGNGDSTFEAKVDYFIGGGPTMIISADFNNDQIIDLASAHYGGDFISVAQNRPGAPDEALADTNTVSTAPDVGTAFRLRLNLGVSDVGLRTGTSYKLRYQLKSGAICSANPLEYSDITTSSPIQFYDNSALVDGLAYVASALDPVRSGVTAVGQSYEESSSFSTTAVIPAGQDGLWDFALTMDAAAPSGGYCLMATKTDNTALTTYTVIPEVTYTAPGPTLGQQMRGGQAVVNGLKSPFSW